MEASLRHSEPIVGRLSVLLHGARGLKDRSWFGLQDPYCVVALGIQSYRTRTAVEGGCDPDWDDTLHFSIAPGDAALSIAVLDRSYVFGDDKCLGTASVPLAAALHCGTDTLHVPVFRKTSGRQQGVLMLSLHFTPAAHSRHSSCPQPAILYPPSAFALPSAQQSNRSRSSRAKGGQQALPEPCYQAALACYAAPVEAARAASQYYLGPGAATAELQQHGKPPTQPRGSAGAGPVGEARVAWPAGPGAVAAAQQVPLLPGGASGQVLVLCSGRLSCARAA